MDDEVAETDQVSNGPLMNRLLSCMRFEHRASPTDDKDKPNGLPNGTNGDITTNGAIDPTDLNNTEDKSLPSATAIPESALPASARNPSNAPKLPVADMDERLKAELRYLGFIGQDAEPDYEGHFDDEVAERLRTLQAELKGVSILNGARKARIEMLAKDQMAHQEYSTILDDLNGQVQQQFSKRSRSNGQKKKPVKKAGGAGGGSHPVAGGGSVARSTINDQTRQLMTRREKWANQIGPIFDEEVTKVRTEGESIFAGEVMEPLMRAERERWDEEAE
jgi:transcriptional adapter 3